MEASLPWVRAEPASGSASLPPGLRESYSNQWADTCPVQWELCGYTLICILTDQSEGFIHNQSG